jgi:phage terminase large subunit GpA-like protein
MTFGIGHNGGPQFETLEEMVVAAAEALRPSARITVSEAAELYHIVKNAGQHEGPFSLAKTPYLREPMDVLTSLDFTGMAFAGPARTGKSAMFINWLCHTALTDPADMMIVHMAQHTARDWSKADLAKAIRNSPELRKRLKPSPDADNVFDKEFLSGMRLVVTWPTVSNLSGKTIPRQWIMDMDRIKPQIIEKEAHVFDATRKRGGTFKRYAMIGAEASPGFPITDPKWKPDPAHPHEAPPCEGILSVYNRGDRRRWYWSCPHCDGKFEPHFDLLKWPTLDTGDIMEMAEQTHMICPHCTETDGVLIEPSMQRELNLAGRWIKEGQIWLPSGEIVGKPRRSDIASFWMFGPAAGFTDWPELVRKYLQASETYEKTGDEGALMTTVNTDQGNAYLPKYLESGRSADALKARAEGWGGHDENAKPFVPPGVRFLIGMVDVQGGASASFVVHIFGVDANGDIWHVDMFKIVKSERRDSDGERLRINPGAFAEDWHALRAVMERTYPLPDGSGRQMGLHFLACDSGGEAGATSNAYDFYRALRAENTHGRFHLLKGAPSKNETALIRKTFPNAQQKDKLSIARGDVPVWLIETNRTKDAANNRLERNTPGGMVHFPDWAENWLYNQLTAEIRLPTGAWDNPAKRRNEAWDLLVYCIAFLDHPEIRIRFMDWETPPAFAAEWDANEHVFGEDRKPQVEQQNLTLEELANRFA